MSEINSRPDWLLGESTEYPRARYLLGVGEADTLTLAKSRARAEIGKIFSVEVQSQIRDTSSFRRSENEQVLGDVEVQKGSRSQSNMQEIQRDIASTSSQVMQGVEVPLAWQDEKTQRYYALAVLPRAKAANALREQIDDMDAATVNLIKSSQASSSLIAKIRSSGEAIRLQQLREALNQQLQVISIDGAGRDAPLSLARLQRDRAGLMARITLQSESIGDQKAAVLQALQDALAGDGFTLKDDGNYVVTAKLEGVTTQPNDQWTEQSATLSVSLSGEGRRSLGGRAWDLRVRSTQAALIDQRLMEKVRDIFNNELEIALFDILEQQ